MKRNLLIISILSLFLLSSLSFAQERERKEIPEQYKWNLYDLYENNDTFLKELESVKGKVPQLAEFKGKLGESGETLFNALNLYFDLSKTHARMVVFTYRLADEDLRISGNQSLKQQTQNFGAILSETAAYIEPEILQIPTDKINEFYGSKPELKEYSIYIDNIQRLREHTLTPNEEEILASASAMNRTPVDVYNIFNNADKSYPKVTLKDGSEVELGAAGYFVQRQSPIREDRKKVFEAFFNGYKQYESTLGANLAGKVSGDWFYAKNRKYNSTLDYSLNGWNIPTKVYKNLIDQIHENLPTLHRALTLKKEMLGLDDLHYYDLYIPIVKEVDMPFTVEEGQDLILKALKPLGKDYLETLKRAYKERWIDYYPSRGKRSGAYSSGAAYDVHPYILLNFSDDYDAVSTFAHELGHSLHSYMTNKNQPFQYMGYSTFVAEIASTFNENLLNDYMINNAKNDEEKLYLLGSYLEMLRTTIFRQVSFAEFEWEIHKKIENKEPLTGEIMSQIYYDIVKKYYGHDKGVCVVDDYIRYEWAYIPHFLNYTYYVYQYSTSIIYSTAFAEKVLKEGQPAVDKYLTMLKSGSNDYPTNLVNKAGIDPFSSEALDLTMGKMNKVIDQIEEILAKKKN